MISFQFSQVFSKAVSQALEVFCLVLLLTKYFPSTGVLCYQIQMLRGLHYLCMCVEGGEDGEGKEEKEEREIRRERERERWRERW